MASMVAPIPLTSGGFGGLMNDDMGSFNITNTSNIFDEEEGEKEDGDAMRRVTMRHKCHLQCL
jgi:hypothetical protein